MGAFPSTSAHSRQHLPKLPRRVSAHVSVEASSHTESNPAFTTGKQIDHLLEVHARIVRSAMKPKLFRKHSMQYEKSLKKYKIALGRLETSLSNLFEAKLKSGREIKMRDWKGQ